MQSYAHTQVVEHVAWLDRELSRPEGALLLCGKPGIGRKSAVLLVAYAHHMEVRHPYLSPLWCSLTCSRECLPEFTYTAGV